MRELDVRHLACPGAVLAVRDALEAGERELRVLVADELARTNVTRFAASRGASAEVEPLPGGGFAVTVRVGSAPPPQTPGEGLPACEVPSGGGSRRPLVLQLAADRMGLGDGELGELLLRAFLRTLAEGGDALRPDVVLCYNAGVRLCCEGSPVLDALRDLAATGTDVAACGTCLEYYGLMDRLAVGRVTDMLEIATRLAGAGRILRP